MAAITIARGSITAPMAAQHGRMARRSAGLRFYILLLSCGCPFFFIFAWMIEAVAQDADAEHGHPADISSSPHWTTTSPCSAQPDVALPAQLGGRRRRRHAAWP